MAPRVLVAMLITVMGIAIGCGTTSTTASGREAQQHFLEGLHETATDIGRYRSDAQLVGLGRAVCDGLHANASIQQVADLIERRGGSNLPPEDLGAVISSAVKNLCPSYGGRLSPVQP